MDRIVQWFGGSEEKEEMKSLGAAGYGSIEEESNGTKMVSVLT
jgi:hypothetical protein